MERKTTFSMEAAVKRREMVVSVKILPWDIGLPWVILDASKEDDATNTDLLIRKDHTDCSAPMCFLEPH